MRGHRPSFLKDNLVSSNTIRGNVVAYNSNLLGSDDFLAKVSSINPKEELGVDGIEKGNFMDHDYLPIPDLVCIDSLHFSLETLNVARNGSMVPPSIRKGDARVELVHGQVDDKYVVLLSVLGFRVVVAHVNRCEVLLWNFKS